jgi:hypothetical protein
MRGVQSDVRQAKIVLRCVCAVIFTGCIHVFSPAPRRRFVGVMAFSHTPEDSVLPVTALFWQSLRSLDTMVDVNRTAHRHAINSASHVQNDFSAMANSFLEMHVKYAYPTVVEDYTAGSVLVDIRGYVG